MALSRRLRGIRARIPAGYLLARISAGDGGVQPVKVSDLVTAGILGSASQSSKDDFLQSLALAMPAEFSVAGSPVTGPGGTLTVTKATETANKVWAGPASGAAAQPTFRALVAADMPGSGAGSGTVTSVALTAPTEFSVGGSPITTNGTLALSWATEAANKVLTGPTTGSAATPSFRSLVAADIPNLSSTYLPLHGTADAALKWATARTLSFTGDATGSGSVDGSANVATALTLPASGVTATTYGDNTHYPTFTVDAKGRLTAASSVAANAGTVTSVAMTVPSRQSVSGSPITASGTLAITDNNQNANLVFAGPTSGLAAGPTFRSLVGADLPNPSATTLGGIQSAAAVTHQWVASISTSGVPALSQPAFPDISGTASTGQIPDLSATYLPLAGGTMSGGIAVNDASAATPGLWWNSASKRGFYNDTTNSGIGISVAGAQIGYFGSSSIVSNSSGLVTTVSGAAANQVLSDVLAQVITGQFSSNITGSRLNMNKARGTRASPTVVAQNDQLFNFRGSGYDGSTYQIGFQIQGVVIEPTPSATAMGSSLRFQMSALGATGSTTEVARLEADTGLSMFGANKVIDQNRTHINRSYTIGTLPTNVTGGTIFCSDLGGGGNMLISDGTNWKRLGINSYEARSLATGAESLNTLTNANFVNYTATLTANVTVTLGTTNAYKGAVFIIRNKGTGAFTFAIVNGGAGAGTLITFAASTAKEATCVYDGTNWVLMQDSLI